VLLSEAAGFADGSYLAVCGGAYSWKDFVSTLNELGQDLQVLRFDPKTRRLSGAHEMRETFHLRGAHLLRHGPREAHWRGRCTHPRRLHRIRRLRSAKYEGESLGHAGEGKQREDARISIS
jgi:hypothetical protein